MLDPKVMPSRAQFLVRAAGVILSFTIMALQLVPTVALGASQRDFPVLETVVSGGTPIAGRNEVIHGILDVKVNRTGTVVFYASFGPPGRVGGPESRVGLFQVDGQRADLIADRTSAVYALDFDVNDRGTIAGTAGDEVRLIRAGSSVVLARQGDLAPQTGARYQEFHSLHDRFIDESDNVIFLADLSDSRRALFIADGNRVDLVAAEGDPIPDRPGEMYESLLSGDQFPIVAGGRVLFQSSPFSLHLWERDRFTTFFGADHTSPSGSRISVIERFDLNEAGTVAVGLRTEEPALGELYLWSEGLLTQVVGPWSELPRFTRPTNFGDVFLDSNSGLLFSARDSIFGGVFVRDRSGDLSAAAIDGDRLPSGEPISLTIGLLPPPPHSFPLENPQYPVMRPADVNTFVFSASAASVGTPGTFLWSHGIIESFPPVRANRTLETPDRLLQSLRPEAIDGQGRVYSMGRFCCDYLGGAVLRSDLDALRRQALPFLASSVGTSASLSYETLVDLLNPSFLHTTTDLSLYWAGGENLLDGSTIVLPPGSAARLRAGDFGGSAVSHGELASPAVRGVTAQARFQIRQNGKLVTQSAIAAEAPAMEHRFLIDNSDGGVSSVGVSNPQAFPLPVEFLLDDADGVRVGDVQSVLAPRARLAHRLQELFPQVNLDQFLGQLRVHSDSPSSAVGFRQRGLQLSFLADMPAPQPPAAFALSTLAPQPQTAENFSFFQYVLFNGEDFAASDFQDALWVSKAGRVQEVLRPLGASGYRSVRLLDFNDSGEVVFLARPDRGGPEEMVRWNGERFEILVTAGDQVSGVNIFFPGITEAIEYSPAGTVAGRERLIFFRADQARVILTGSDPIPDGVGGTWGFVVDVDSNVHGDFAFRTENRAVLPEDGAVGLFRGEAVQVLARLGQPLGPGLPTPRSFGRIHLTDDGDVFLGAGLDPDDPAKTGLFVFSKGSWSELLASGQAAPHLPGFTIRDVGIESFQVNRGGEAAVVAGLDPGPQAPSTGGAFFVVSAAGAPLLLTLDSSYSPFSDFEVFRYFDDFSWNDQGWLAFTARDLQGNSLLLRTHRGDPVERLMSAGQPPALFYSRRTALIEQFRRVYAVDSEGWPVVDAEVSGDSSSGLFAVRPDNPHQLLFSHLVSGQFGDYRAATTLLVRNSGPDTARASVEFVDQTGEVQSRRELVLEPAHTEAFALDLPESFVGWARLESVGGPIDAVARIRLQRAGKPESEVAIPSNLPTLRGTLLAEYGDGVSTGVAVANPYGRSFQVTFAVRFPGTSQELTAVVELAPGEQRAVLFPQLFDLAEAETGRRIVTFDSPYPVPVIALAIEESLLTSVPIAR